MSATPRETFREKAPHLSLETLAEVVRQDVLAPPVREAADAIWLHGPFADPDSGIDREDLETPGGAHGLSDVDVFVVLDDWGENLVDTRFIASERGLLCRLAAQGELSVRTDSDCTGRLNRPAVPDHVRTQGLLPADAVETTIRRAERTVFHVREFDAEHLQLRALDLALGGPVAFDRLLADEPRVRLWPELDSGNSSH